MEKDKDSYGLLNHIFLNFISKQKINNTKPDNEIREKNQTSIVSFIKFPKILNNEIHTPDEPEQSNKETIFNTLSTFFGIKISISDPLGIIVMSALSIFFYIYFANSLLCQLIGLVYPTYHMYKLIVNKKEYNPEPIMKYSIIYSHLEIYAYMAQMILSVYHLKLLIIMALIYMLEYQTDWLDHVYQKTILYDKIMINLMHRLLRQIREESIKINAEYSSKKIENYKSNEK